MKNTIWVSFVFVWSLNGFAQTKNIVKFTAVGDIMLGTYYPTKSTLPLYDCFGLFKPLYPYLKNADVTFGNLEGTFTDDISQVKKCKSDSNNYFFAMPTSYAKSLRYAGFNVISIANNHINDFGEIGRKSTVAHLKRHKINFAGLASYPVDTFTRKGIRYGFCAFAPNAWTLSIKDINKAEKVVRRLQEISDIVIVSFHAGGEGVKYEKVTRKTEFYMGENRGNVHEFAHRMIDAGADILLGHGPHITRAIEIYKNRFITYSMGNFCTYSRISVQGKNGIAPLYQIYTNRKGEFLKAQIIPTYQDKGAAPLYDKRRRAISVVRKLTFTDFPEMAKRITISDNGWIEKINLLSKN